MQIKLRVDSRDYHFYKQYGQTTEFPKEFRVKETCPDFVQPAGDVRCTCITCCDIATDKTGIAYDIDDLFKRIPNSATGANPRDALNETVKWGLLPVGQFERMREFRSYWSAHSGYMSAFDNVRSVLSIANYPVAIWGGFYNEWNYSSIMTKGTSLACYHMFTVSGWTEKYGVPMLTIDAWTGREMYMSAEVFNWYMAQWGSGSAVLDTGEVWEKKQKTYLEAIVDGLKNLYLGLEAYVTSKKKAI